MRKATLKDFERVFQIIKESFPKDEYRSFEGQKKLFDNEKYNMYVIEYQEKIISFIAFWNMEDFVYGEHMAVTEAGRNQGLGGKMIVTAAEEAKSQGKIFCLEVEPPEETSMAERRIRFYERMGFVLNYYPYMQPPLEEGKNSIPLMLMSYEKGLSEDEFEKVKETLYREVYKVI